MVVYISTGIKVLISMKNSGELWGTGNTISHTHMYMCVYISWNWVGYYTDRNNFNFIVCKYLYDTNSFFSLAIGHITHQNRKHIFCMCFLVNLSFMLHLLCCLFCSIHICTDVISPSLPPPPNFDRSCCFHFKENGL